MAPNWYIFDETFLKRFSNTAKMTLFCCHVPISEINLLFLLFSFVRIQRILLIDVLNAERKPSRENVLKKTAASCFCQNENLIFCLDDHHFIIIIILEIFQRRCRQVGNKNKQSGLTTTAIYVTLPHSMIVSLRVF